MANTDRRTTRRNQSSVRNAREIYVDGNTVRKVQEVPQRREYRTPEQPARRKQARPKNGPQQEVIRKSSRALSKEVQRNRAKANRMNRNFAIFLTIMGVMVVGCSINYLRLKTEYTRSVKEVAALESELAQLKEDNDAYESQVASGVDLNTIRKIALGRLGMKYPSDEQTEYYTIESGSYLRQYQDMTEEQN